MTENHSSDSHYKTVKVWDPYIRVWHWLLAISVISGWLLGELRTFSLMQWHIYLGYCTGILILLRILWGIIGPANVRLRNLFTRPNELLSYTKTLSEKRPSGLAGHNPLGAISVIVMLTLVSIQVVTGLFSEDDALFHSGPFAHLLSSKMIVEMTHIHHICAKLILIIVSLHLTAVFYYLFWKKENLIKAMITGKKLVKTQTEKATNQKAGFTDNLKQP